MTRNQLACVRGNLRERDSGQRIFWTLRCAYLTYASLSGHRRHSATFLIIDVPACARVRESMIENGGGGRWIPLVARTRAHIPPGIPGTDRSRSRSRSKDVATTPTCYLSAARASKRRGRGGWCVYDPSSTLLGPVSHGCTCLPVLSWHR